MLCGQFPERSSSALVPVRRLGAVETSRYGVFQGVGAVHGVARRSGPAPGFVVEGEAVLEAGYPAVSRCTSSRNTAWSGHELESRTETVRV